MSKSGNRYLNLMGAPWTPEKPARKMTITNSLSAILAGAAIFGVLQSSNSQTNDQAARLGEALAGGAVALTFRRIARGREAAKLNPHHQDLVIDTQPDQHTPPTDHAMLQRVDGLKSNYHGSIFRPSTLKGAFSEIVIASANSYTFMTTPSFPMAAFFATHFSLHAADVLSRYRQLDKISKRAWVITDKGDAVKTYQKEKLAASKPRPVLT